MKMECRLCHLSRLGILLIQYLRSSLKKHKIDPKLLEAQFQWRVVNERSKEKKITQKFAAFVWIS